MLNIYHFHNNMSQDSKYNLFHIYEVFYNRTDIYRYSNFDLNYIFYHQIYIYIRMIYALLIFSIHLFLMMMMMMMMMMMNCFCGMVEQWKTFSLIFSRDHCQRFSPLRISDTACARFEPAQNLSSGFVEWSCAVVITTTAWHLHIM